MPYGRPRPVSPYIGGMQATRGACTGGYGYQQPLSYNYQQGLVYPPCGYATYGPEYAYSQGQTIPGDQGYPTVHGYAILAQQIILFGGPSVNEVTTSTVPSIQATYHTAVSPTGPPRMPTMHSMLGTPAVSAPPGPVQQAPPFSATTPSMQAPLVSPYGS
ncbi:hypothetical protein TB1_029255 [Malus domestica]